MSSYPEWIMGRSFGGARVADASGAGTTDGSWPRGETAPAAEACCRLLVDACNENEPGNESLLVFLVGGAGNGKSFLAREVTNEIHGERLGQRDRFASRTYRYRLKNDKELDVVNDATIPPDKETQCRDYLVRDIERVLENKGNLLACVNRGVLVSELNNLGDAKVGCLYGIAGKLVRWLLEDTVDTVEGDSDWRLEVQENDKKGEYYKCCSLAGPDAFQATVHVAFMDQVSLLEPRPTEGYHRVGPPCVPLRPGNVVVAPILSADRASSDLPAHGVLARYFEKVLDSVPDCSYPGGDIDPVHANITALRDSQVLHGLCSVLRGAEIISGSHLTYRDLWGLAVLATTGPVVPGGLSDYAELVKDLAHRSTDPSAEPVSRLLAVVALASRRFHMTLFSASLPAVQGKPPAQSSYPPVQAMAALAMADPLVSLRGDIVDKVRDKLLLLDERAGPGARLASEDPLFQKAWGPLDQLLENTLLEWLYEGDEGPGFRERNELLSWYGHYLFRLYAVVHGSPGHAELVNKWQETWNKVHSPGGELTRALKRLLFTSFEPDGGDTFLPLFSPRVAPIVKGDDGKRVAVRIQSDRYWWSLDTRGDSIIARLNRNDAGEGARAELVLDFPLLREVFARAEGLGFTDAAIDVEPRVERMRAEILLMEVSCERTGVAFVDGNLVIS